MNFTEYDNSSEILPTTAEALSNPPGRPLWLADLVFYRDNRSVKYIANGEKLILAEVTPWNEVWLRVLENFEVLLIFLLSIIFNFVFFFMSLSKAKRSDHRKVQCLLANLAACNILLSSGFFIYTYLIDIYYDVDSINTLLNSNNNGSKYYSIWPAAKQVIHYVLIDNISLSQSFIILMISFDRYLSLFEGYSPYLKTTVFKLILAILPYFLGLVIFDLQLLTLMFGDSYAIVIRLAAFMTPIPLSLVFTVCSVFGGLQKPPGVRRKRDKLSCSIVLLVILLLQLIEKFGFFMQLLHQNFNFEIIIGSVEGDIALKKFLRFCYLLSKYLFLLSPLYTCILILLMVRFYQLRLISFFGRFWRLICCKKREHLDYSTETMRSIIAEQARQRQMKAFGY